MFGIIDFIFIAIYFVIMALILSSMYLHRLTGGDIAKALIVAILIRVTIILVSYVISQINPALGALEIAYVSGLWVSFAISKYFWEDKISGSKLVNMVSIVLIITILIVNMITLIFNL